MSHNTQERSGDATEQKEQKKKGGGEIGEKQSAGTYKKPCSLSLTPTQRGCSGG